MDAFILAAGLGTRLRPLTYDVPKALVEVGGRPLLAHTADRLIAAGADRLIVNISALADKIRQYVEARGGLGAETLLSEEPGAPLETGGGLLKAAPLFRKDAPFFIHNADILTDLDLRALYAAHLDAQDTPPLATLAVRDVTTDRYLLFDDRGLLGYAYGGEEHQRRTPEGAVTRYDFCGVHVVAPRLFELFEEEGTFSIMRTYLRLTQQGERIVPHHIGDARWIDVGTHERLAEAEAAFG